MRPLYKKSIKDMTQRKLRAALTILGIAIGVLGLTAISITQGQIKSAIQYAQDVSVAPDIVYYTTPASGSLVAELARQPNVKVVQAAGDVSTQWKVPSGHKPLDIVGVPNLEDITLNKFELSSGSWPGPGQILMESSNSTLAPVHVGDRITVRAAGVPHTLTVSGLTRSRGRAASSVSGGGTGLAYMELSQLQRAFHTEGVNYFLLGLKQYRLRQDTANALLPIFAAHHVTVLQTVVGHPEGLDTMTSGMLAVMRVLSVIALLLSVFLLLTTITTLVTEQVRIVGTMKAIGATRAAVMRNYLSLVGILGVIGTTVGFVLGLIVAYVLSGLIGSMFTLDSGGLTIGAGTILLALLVGIGVPMLAAVLPIYLGTRVTVHEALSGYGVTQAGHGVGRRSGLGRIVARILSIAPRTAQLGIRNVFCRRTRALLTLLALSISGATFLSVQSASTSLSSAINHVFDTYNFHMLFELNKPAPYADVQRILRSVPGVAGTERLSQMPIKTRWGEGTLTGVEPHPQLYRRNVISGRWFTPGDRNVIILSKTAAERSHLRVGDMLAFHDDLHAARWRVIGIAVDNNNLGMTFGLTLAPIGQVNTFQGVPRDYTYTVMVRASSEDQSAINALSSRIDSRLAAAGLSTKIQTAKEFKDAVTRLASIMSILLYAVAVIVALVGAIGLFNTLAMSVLERRREIGILRSMGATGRIVAGVFLTEAMELSVFAWAIAIVIGIPAAYGFVQVLGRLMLQVPFVFNPVSLVLMLAFIIAVAALASMIPVWGAARVRIAETLRYEG